jgi:hypothetical protein
VTGDLELNYEVIELSADTELRLAIFTAEPSSRSEQALNLLASWAATPEDRFRANAHQSTMGSACGAPK